MTIDFLPRVITSALEDVGILEPQKNETEIPQEAAPAGQNDHPALTALKVVVGVPLFALSGFGLFGGCNALLDDEHLAAPAGLRHSKDDCDIVDDATASLSGAISYYNRDNEENRECLRSIRLFHSGAIAMPEGFTITQAPAKGSPQGTAIRTCEPGEASQGFDCPVDGGSPVILDFSAYEKDGGDCPVKVFSGAKVELSGFEMKVNNPEKAICTGSGQPIPLEDKSNPFAFIHNVTIIGPGTE